MTFAWIEERKGEWPVTHLCRVLEVSRSGFYAWLSREPSAADVRREELTAEVSAWCRERNLSGSPLDWRFDTPTARRKLKRVYPKLDESNQC